MAPSDKKSLFSPPADDIEKLRAENEALKKKLELAKRGAVSLEGKVLQPEHRGTKTYRVRVAHYRNAVYYEAGSLITVTDEVPSKTWELVDEAPARAAAALVPAPVANAPQRMSDTSV